MTIRRGWGGGGGGAAAAVCTAGAPSGAFRSMNYGSQFFAGPFFPAHGMDRYEVTIFRKGGIWNGRRPRRLLALNAKAAAEAVLKKELRTFGSPRELRATVWREGDPPQTSTSFYLPDPP